MLGTKKIYPESILKKAINGCDLAIYFDDWIPHIKILNRWLFSLSNH